VTKSFRICCPTYKCYNSTYFIYAFVLYVLDKVYVQSICNQGMFFLDFTSKKNLFFCSVEQLSVNKEFWTELIKPTFL